MANPDLLEWRNVNERILITHDRHFLELHHAGAPHAGIADCRAGTRSIGQIVAALMEIVDEFAVEDMFGYIEFL